MVDRIGKYILAFLVLSALGVRLFFLQYAPPLAWDACAYTSLAKELMAGNLNKGLHGYWPPWYPLMIGFFSLWVKDLELSSRLVSVVFGSALILPMFFLAKECFGKKVAWWGSLLAIFHPWLITGSNRSMPEMCYTFWVLLAIYINYLSLKTGSGNFFFLSGLLFGVCYLTRAEGAGYLLLAAGLNLVYGLKGIFQQSIKKQGIGIILLFIGFLLISFPYLLFLRSSTGTWTLTTKGEANLLMSSGDQKLIWGLLSAEGETLGEKIYLKGEKIPLPGGTINYLKSNLKEISYRYLKNLYLEYEVKIPTILPPLLLALVIFGLLGKEKTLEDKKEITYLGVFVSYPFLVYPLTSLIEVRPYFSCIPLFLIWAGRGIDNLSYWLSGKYNHSKDTRGLSDRKNSLLLGGLLIVAVFFSLIPRLISLSFRENPSGHKKIALWMKNHLPTEVKTMNMDACLDFYRGVNQFDYSVPIPYADYPLIIEHARKRGVRYIVLEEHLITTHRPQLKFLFEEGVQVPKDLKLVYQVEEKPGHKFLIYQVINPPSGQPEGTTERSSSND